MLYFITAAILLNGASGCSHCPECWTFNKKYVDDNYVAKLAAATIPDCQKLCQITPGCTKFTWYDDSHACWMQTDAAGGAVPFNKAGVLSAVGPRDCPEGEGAIPITPPVSKPVPTPTPGLVGAGAVGAGARESWYNETLSGSIPLWAIILLAALCCLAGLIAAALMASKKHKKVGGRGRKPAREAIPLVPQVPVQQVQQSAIMLPPIVEEVVSARPVAGAPMAPTLYEHVDAAGRIDTIGGNERAVMQAAPVSTLTQQVAVVQPAVQQSVIQAAPITTLTQQVAVAQPAQSVVQAGSGFAVPAYR